MSLDLPAVHEQALVWTDRVITGIRPAQMSDPTPCEDWDVRQVLNHLVSGNLWVTPLMTGITIADVGDRLDGDVVGNEWAAAYEESAKEAAETFFRPGAMDDPALVSYGPVPGSVYCGHRIIDVAIHGWDLAEATRQDTDIPDALVDAVWEIFEPQAEVFRGSGAVAEALQVSGDADKQTRLLAEFGRKHNKLEA